MVGPDITAAAAEAAVAALCDETACPREIFDGEEDFPSNGFSSPSFHSKSKRLFIYVIFILCCSCDYCFAPFLLIHVKVFCSFFCFRVDEVDASEVKQTPTQSGN